MRLLLWAACAAPLGQERCVVELLALPKAEAVKKACGSVAELARGLADEQRRHAQGQQAAEADEAKLTQEVGLLGKAKRGLEQKLALVTGVDKRHAAMAAEAQKAAELAELSQQQAASSGKELAELWGRSAVLAQQQRQSTQQASAGFAHLTAMQKQVAQLKQEAEAASGERERLEHALLKGAATARQAAQAVQGWQDRDQQDQQELMRQQALAAAAAADLAAAERDSADLRAQLEAAQKEIAELKRANAESKWQDAAKASAAGLAQCEQQAKANAEACTAQLAGLRVQQQEALAKCAAKLR